MAGISNSSDIIYHLYTCPATSKSNQKKSVGAQHESLGRLHGDGFQHDVKAICEALMLAACIVYADAVQAVGADSLNVRFAPASPKYDEYRL